MSHFDRFIEYARSMIGEIDAETFLPGADFVDDVDDNLHAYGRYILDRAGEIDPETLAHVDASNEIDYGGNKEHFLVFHADYRIGGRQYRVVLDQCKFPYGKMAEDTLDFHNQTVGLIKSVIKNYHHVLEHVQPEFRGSGMSIEEMFAARGSADRQEG